MKRQNGKADKKKKLVFINFTTITLLIFLTLADLTLGNGVFWGLCVVWGPQDKSHTKNDFKTMFCIDRDI